MRQPVRRAPLLAYTCALLALLSCESPLVQPDAAVEGPLSFRAATAASPAGASISVQVQVPASMRTAPFDVPRYLTVPPGFSVSVYTRITRPRFLAVTPDGRLLVSQPSTGKVLLVRAGGSGDPIVTDFMTGLRKPHDLVFHTIGATTWLYVAETHQVSRYSYSAGHLTGQGRQIVVTGLPDASSPGLNGAYGHQLKNIALDANHKLYVSIASTCNACVSDTQSNPVRGSIYQYNADGSGRRLFARGIRNAEGLDVLPGTNQLWVVINNRDNIAYPFHHDWNSDGSDDYGKVLQSYVNNHPPEGFTRVVDGANYGWPFCNSTQHSASGYDRMPYDRDVQLNASGGALDCGTARRIDQGIQAHSASLGLLFLHDTNFPSAYRNGAAIAYHGSWNRTQKTGYKVVHFAWDAAAQQPAQQVNLVTGWATSSSNWGRPVDIGILPNGDMLISDDAAHAVYRLSSASTAARVYEAELAHLVGALVASAHPGYTGSGYADYQRGSGDAIEWSVDAASTGTHTLTFRYALYSGDRPLEIRVNGVVVAAQLKFPATGSWATWKTVSLTAPLNAGQNQVRAATVGWNGGNIDHLAVSH